MDKFKKALIELLTETYIQPSFTVKEIMERNNITEEELTYLIQKPKG